MSPMVSSTCMNTNISEEFVCAGCEETTTKDRHQQKPQQHPQGVFFLKDINRRVKRCQGCPGPFTTTPFRRLRAVFLTDEYTPPPGCTSHRISVDRNFYFHIDKKCINKFKRNFNGRVFIDKNMTELNARE